MFVRYTATFYKIVMHGLGFQESSLCQSLSCSNSHKYAKSHLNSGCYLYTVKTITCCDAIVGPLFLLAPCFLYFLLHGSYIPDVYIVINTVLSNI